MSSPSPRRALATLVALLAGLSLLVARPAPVEAQPAAGCWTLPAVPSAAKLRVRVTSTAATVDVHVRPGQVTGRKDGTITGGATTSYVADGLRVSVPAGSTGVVATEIVAVDPSLAGNITISLDKAAGGSASVRIWASSGYGRAVTLAATGTTAQITVPRSTLFDPSFSLPKADRRKLVLAAYYPWFTSTGWDGAAVAETPLDPRSVWSAAGVLSMTRQARDHGVDGFVVSWMGSDKNGAAYDLAAAAAAETGGVVAPYLETSEGLARGGVATVEQWLREAVDRTGSASLTMGAAPVVFVWDMAKISSAEWAAILARLGRPVRLVGDASTATHGTSMRGWHAYLPPADLTGTAERNAFRSAWFRGQAALDASITPMAHVATVSPGFDDRALRGDDRPVVSRAGGRYAATWDAAVAGDPDMILITSWNEWFEGTEIEPGTRNGGEALRTTALRSAAWKAAGSSSCTKRLATVRGTTATRTAATPRRR